MNLILLLSLAALLAGPLTYRRIAHRPERLALLDGFVFVSIGGLVLLEVVPVALAAGGIGVLALVPLGLFGPSLLERLFRPIAEQTHLLTLALGVAGLVLHTLIDGAALAVETDAHGHGLSWSVLLHRLPVGLTVWWLLRERFGPLLPSVVLFSMLVGTLLGHSYGGAILATASGPLVAAFQALVAGSILHVVFFRPHIEPQALEHGEPAEAGCCGSQPPPKSTRQLRLAEGMGNLLGLALLLPLLLGHHEFQHQGQTDFLHTLAMLTIASAPALLLAYAAAGLLGELMPPNWVNWLRSGSAFSQAGRGMAIGLPLPICTCGVLPLYRNLVMQGTPPTAALAFLIATPELGLDAVLLSFPLLGIEMTLIRVGAAVLVALLVGWLLGRTMQARPVVSLDLPVNKAVLGKRVMRGLAQGYGPLVDRTAPWIVLGLVIAAAAQPLLADSFIQQLPAGLEIPLFALLGMPIYVCASAATPIVAVLLATGVSPGAALAFLLTGPATNISTFGVLRDLHSARVAAIFAVLTAGAAIGLGYATNWLLPDFSPVATATEHGEHAGTFGLICVALLCLLYLLSLIRRGARDFVGELWGHDHSDAHEHEHGPDDKHDHDHKHDPATAV